MTQDGDRKGILPQIIVTVVVTLLVGSTSPWWWNEIVNREHGSQEVQGPSNAINRNIEELREQLEANSRQQEMVLRNIEHLKARLETSPDVEQAIMEQERSLNELAQQRERMEQRLRQVHE